MNKKILDMSNDVVKLISIERKMKHTNITKKEAGHVRALAENYHFPRAEYILSMMYYDGCVMEKNVVKAQEYLAKSRKHAGNELLIKIAYTYLILGDYNKTIECLEQVIEDCKHCY